YDGIAGRRSTGQGSSSRVIAAACTRTSASPGPGLGRFSSSTTSPCGWSRTARTGAPYRSKRIADEGVSRRAAAPAAAAGGRPAGAGSRALTETLGGAERTRVVVLLAAVLALSSADASTVGASATHLRHDLHISNTDVGLLVSVTSLVAAIASLPFGVLADRVRRTWTLGFVIVLWGAAMIWSATVPDFGQLLVARLALGAVTAAAGPFVASLLGDYFPG